MAAVDHQVLSADETAGVAGEVERRLRDILGQTGTRQRLGGREALLEAVGGALRHGVRQAGAFREDAGDDGAPGEMLLTRMPFSPSSAATQRVTWITAALAAE